MQKSLMDISGAICFVFVYGNLIRTDGPAVNRNFGGLYVKIVVLQYFEKWLFPKMIIFLLKRYKFSHIWNFQY